ncbi:hypothetical protein LBMAG57_01280 [Verrucomicrobiota bacterium]|nr:hypothetical protein LBMAG57_01280 [Verrucomicrobiota bacterium]
MQSAAIADRLRESGDFRREQWARAILAGTAKLVLIKRRRDAETQRRSEDSRQIAATCGARVIAFAFFSVASLRPRV